ncbi:CLUMA_CG002799, isoform A [Clunio marinus]|uniref:CLUMA_CG002799, isoform A n=1 Tax=Clunio marinus TaxID=568069 RepID=A0A1J1HLY7_9DIPT|nr:CLUMA_CG002799, isoform A [Clunio marinus]
MKCSISPVMIPNENDNMSEDNDESYASKIKEKPEDISLPQSKKFKQSYSDELTNNLSIKNVMLITNLTRKI